MVEAVDGLLLEAGDLLGGLDFEIADLGLGRPLLDGQPSVLGPPLNHVETSGVILRHRPLIPDTHTHTHNNNNNSSNNSNSSSNNNNNNNKDEPRVPRGQIAAAVAAAPGRCRWRRCKGGKEEGGEGEREVTSQYHFTLIEFIWQWWRFSFVFFALGFRFRSAYFHTARINESNSIEMEFRVSLRVDVAVALSARELQLAASEEALRLVDLAGVAGVDVAFSAGASVDTATTAKTPTN